MMPSLSGLGWTVYCLLLWRQTSAHSAGMRCSAAAPVGNLHPVQGLLERFEAGPGCAARERGNKETHVIAVGRVTNSPENKVTVLLKPLSLSPSPLRAPRLLLSSKLPFTWWLEAERLPPNLPVLVQISSNSSVHSHTLRLHVQVVHSLPFHPRALHRWALKHHGSLSSLTHTTHGNRVYVPLGEDPTLPDVCQLQPMFLSHNYMTSDLQRQEVRGCADAPAGRDDPEVHVIKLHSAGSGLCGSLQVEVIVSLVPLVADSKTQKVVLILSSSAPVNWAVVARGVRGHVSVHASNSVSPPFPPEPDLTLSSALSSDLSTAPDLLAWAREGGHARVTSYTEADLANRFVIRLAGGGTDAVAAVSPLVVRPHWAEERRLRQWLSGGGRAGGGGGGGGGGRESFAVRCEDGRLSVTVEQHILQSLPLPVASVTLRDSSCQAQSNGSHFLLVFPVISCGTEGLLLRQPRRVQYKNMVLLWRDKPQTVLAHNETEKKSARPLGIHFTCLAAVPALTGPDDVNVNAPRAGPDPLAPDGPGPDPGLSRPPTPRHRSGPALVLRLSVTENYEQRRVGPCVVSADHRVYAEISARGPLIDVLEVDSCVVSPASDPKKSRFWSVISGGCSSDPSLTLEPKDEEEEEEEEAESDGELEEEKEEMEELGKASSRHGVDRGGREAAARSGGRARAEQETRPVRFSFILRPVYNDSMQFLHCSLRLCVSGSRRGEAVKERVKTGCEDGIRIPPLVSRSPKHQCEVRNLSRPMVVTQPLGSLVPKLLMPPAGQRTKRLSVSPVASSPDPEQSGSVVRAGPLMGVVFAAFAMGVSLMAGLWWIYHHTAARPASRGEGCLRDRTRQVQNIWSPPSPSNQSSSSV